MVDFEEKVLAGLSQCNVNLDAALKIGVAVSGGADSVSLLCSLSNILTPLNIKLYVITVNHYIRPDEETCGDVQFVVDLCNKLKTNGKNIALEVVELSKGQVQSVAETRNAGIEEAARFLRYGAFDEFIKKNELKYLCLAHNKNDNYETLLMRFLQGSSIEGLRGILPVREPYIRPLINIDRQEIENYLLNEKTEWRTDKTNNDVSYLRNKIRHELIPFLDSNFNNWKLKVDMSAKRAADDFMLIENVLSDINISEANFFNLEEFNKFSEPLQKRVLLKMCNRISSSQRISYSFICDVCDLIREEKSFSKTFEDIEIILENRSLFVKKYVKKQTDLCFSDIINMEGFYEYPFGTVKVSSKEEGFDFYVENKEMNNAFSVTIKNLPVCIRNYRLGDEVLCNDGNYKKLQDVFVDWHVSKNHKELIPIIEDITTSKRDILCVIGELFGYKNWIVKTN